MIYNSADREILASLGGRLKRHRLQQNLSAAALAAKAGLSRLTVLKAEAGQNPTMMTVVRMLRALGQLEGIASLAPAPVVSPLALLEAGAKPARQRAGRRRT